MTTASGASEVDQLKARNLELGEEMADLLSQIEDLRGQLAELRYLGPYNSAADVIAVLTTLLPGWPSRRWSKLGALIEQRAASCRRTA